MRWRGLAKREEPRPESPLPNVICGNPKSAGFAEPSEAAPQSATVLFTTNPRQVFSPMLVFGLPNRLASCGLNPSSKRLKPKRASFTLWAETTLTRLTDTRFTFVGD